MDLNIFIINDIIKKISKGAYIIMKRLSLLLCLLTAFGLIIQGCSENSPASSGSTAAAAAAETAANAKIDENKTYDYEVKEIWCKNGGNKIYGQAYIPKAGGKLPLIITSHGLGANYESGASYAKKYAPRGFAVYTFDFCGGSNKNHENKSGGSNLEMSVMTEVSDLEAVMETAKTWDFVDTKRIFLQGGSQGGLVSAITGIKHEDEIRGLILLYPAFGMYDFVHGFYDYDNVPDEIEISSMTVGKNFVTDLWDYDAREYLPDFKKPVIIIQGSDDNIVLPSSSVAANELLPNSEYHEIKGAGHGFSGEKHTEAAELAIDFVFKHI